MTASGSWLEPRTSATTAGDVSDLLKTLEDRGGCRLLHQLLANGTATFRPFVRFGSALMFRTNVPAIDRETMILRLAALHDNEYEWEEHVRIARDVGLPDQQIENVRGGAIAGNLSEGQSLAIRLANATFAQRAFTRSEVYEATAVWGPEGALDAVMIGAFWGAFVPGVLRSIGVAHFAEAVPL